MKELKDFLNTLFDPKEFIWVNNKVTGCPTACPVHHLNFEALINSRGDAGIFFVLHPSNKDYAMRHGDNSKEEFRNFLIEFDDIELEDQKKLVKDLKMPYTSAVFSGRKSIHYIISLEESLNYDEYLKWFNFIQELTNCDTANKCKVRYSRLPCTYRGEVEQELIELKDRIPNEDFFNWLESPKIRKIRMFNSYEKRQKKRKIKKTSNGSRSGVEDLVSWYLHDYLGKDPRENLIHVSCPVCVQDGHDRSGDNLSIDMDEYAYRCWYDPDDHNRRMLAVIDKLKNPGKKKREGAF